MNNFHGKFEKICEETLYRYQQLGFLTGDYVKIKENALQDPIVKLMSDPMKAMLQTAIKNKTPLRVSYIKSGKSEAMSGPVDASNIPSSVMWCDVVTEYAPGMWKDPMTLPVTVLERILPNSEAEGYAQYPDSLKRDNRTDNEMAKAERVMDTQTMGKDANRSLTDKNKKLEHTPAPKDGLSQTKITESQSWKRDVRQLSEAYDQIAKQSLSKEAPASILQDILQAVYNATDLETAKAIFKDRVAKSRIPDTTKRKMLVIDMPRIGTLEEFQRYVTNSMLKKMGMGV